MDATAALIIVVFVVSIFTSLGGKGGRTPTAPPGTIYSEVSVPAPAPKFPIEETESPRSAIERYVKKYRNNDESAAIADSIVRHSQTYDLNPKLVTALIARESRFNPRAISSSGAIGLGQLLPSTAKGLNLDDPYDIDQNVKGTVRYFKSLVDRFNGKVPSAIASYLEGPNAVDRQGGFSGKTKEYVEDILNISQRI